MPESLSTGRRATAKPKIERAALKLFVDQGVDASTTREIASLAGVSEGALYRHYAGKDELALHLFMLIHNRLGEMLHQALTSDGSLEEKIRLAVTAYCKLADEDWLLFSFHLASLNRFLPYDTRRDDDPVTILERIVDSLMRSNQIPEGDPAVVTSMCLGIVMQAGQAKIYNRIQGPLSKHVDCFATAILAVLHRK